MKRVLIVTYYWPPAGGPGVQRWLSFVKHLREFDVEPIVYIPENPHYPLKDTNLIEQVPKDVEILKHPIKEPYRLAGLFSKKKTVAMSSGIITEKKQSLAEKLLLYIRGNFFIPDARIGWVRPSVTFLTKWLGENTVDAVITTGPPHSLHLIGLGLKSKLPINWIADFRDPWTTIHYHKSLRLSKASAKKHLLLEAEVLKNADRIIVTSPTTKTEFEAITERPIKVITNGFEPMSTAVPDPDKTFSIAHVGSLLSERNPEILWEVLSELINEHEAFAKQLEIKLAGVVSDDVLNSMNAYGLADHCRVLGYLDHADARLVQHNAQVLLLVEMDRPETRAIIPGKLFEYLSARRPIIALGPPGSDISAILENTHAGAFFTYSERLRIKAQLLAYFEAFQQDKLSVNSKGIENYSRKQLTLELSELIYSL